MHKYRVEVFNGVKSRPLLKKENHHGGSYRSLSRQATYYFLAESEGQARELAQGAFRIDFPLWMALGPPGFWRHQLVQTFLALPMVWADNILMAPRLRIQRVRRRVA